MNFLAPSLSCQIPNINEFYRRYFDEPGIFVEVGANDGYSWSNTWHLAQAGWQGLYFEPVEALAKKCAAKHAKNNVTVVQAAVGSFDGEAKLYTGEGATTSDHVARNNTYHYGNSPDKFIMVPACKLNTALENMEIPHNFDLLVIDVDGDEVGVLRGIDLSLWRPIMVIIEACKTHTNQDWRFNCRGIEARLGCHYREIWHDHINSIFVRKDLDMQTLFENKRDTLLRVGGWYGCVNFVETGTGHGDMLAAVHAYFKAAHSIELDPALYQQAQARFRNVSNVMIYPGDSGTVLPRILPFLEGTTLFYLDAHFSGLGTAKGSKETPILAELKTLLAPGSKAIILIDDLKHFTGQHDFPTIPDLEKYARGLQAKLLFEVLPDGGGMILIAPVSRKRNLTRKLIQVAPVVKPAQPVIAEGGTVSQPDYDKHKWERGPILYGPYRNPPKKED